MTNMPTKSQFTGSITNGERKAAEEQMIDFLSQYLPIDGSKLPAENIANTPSGNVISTDLQGVVNEFDGRVGANPSFRNKIINGDFYFWHRGGSQTSSGYGSDDRWNNLNVGSTKTHSQQTFTLGQTDVLGNPKFFSRTIVTCVTGAGNCVAKYQKIERVNTLSGQTATLSFWAKADTSKNMAIEFIQYFGSGGSPSSSIYGIEVTTISLTTSWKKYTVTVNIPSIAGKTLGTDNTDNLSVLFWFDAGSNFNSRTNNLGQQSGTFDMLKYNLKKVL